MSETTLVPVPVLVSAGALTPILDENYRPTNQQDWAHYWYSMANKGKHLESLPLFTTGVDLSPEQRKAVWQLQVIGNKDAFAGLREATSHTVSTSIMVPAIGFMISAACIPLCSIVGSLLSVVSLIVTLICSGILVYSVEKDSNFKQVQLQLINLVSEVEHANILCMFRENVRRLCTRSDNVSDELQGFAWMIASYQENKSEFGLLSIEDSLALHGVVMAMDASLKRSSSEVGMRISGETSELLSRVCEVLSGHTLPYFIEERCHPRVDTI